MGTAHLHLSLFSVCCISHVLFFSLLSPFSCILINVHFCCDFCTHENKILIHLVLNPHWNNQFYFLVITDPDVKGFYWKQSHGCRHEWIKAVGRILFLPMPFISQSLFISWCCCSCILCLVIFFQVWHFFCWCLLLVFFFLKQRKCDIGSLGRSWLLCNPNRKLHEMALLDAHIYWPTRMLLNHCW